MHSWERTKILNLLFEASRIALEIKKDPKTIAKADKSAVTLADGLIEKFLTKELAEDSCPLVGEETSPEKGNKFLADALKGDCWIVDPIDGTANFAASYDIWAISIGFARGGILREGAVYLPEKGDILMTDGEKVLHGISVNPGSPAEMEATLRELSPAEKKYQVFSVLNLSQKICRKARINLPNQVLVVGSCVAAGVTLAKGLDLAYITSAKLWDLAGILPSLQRLGYKSAALNPVPGESNMEITSCRILPEYYKMDFGAKDAFSLKRTVILCRDEETIRILQEGIDCPE